MFVTENPERGRALLSANPQFASAILQALVVNDLADGSIIPRLQDTDGSASVNPTPPPPSWSSAPAPYYPPVPAAPPSAPANPPGLDSTQQVWFCSKL